MSAVKPIAGSAVASQESIGARNSRREDFKKWWGFQMHWLDGKYRLMLKHPGPCIVFVGGFLFIVRSTIPHVCKLFPQRFVLFSQSRASIGDIFADELVGQFLVTSVILMGALTPRCFSHILPWYVSVRGGQGQMS